MPLPKQGKKIGNCGNAIAENGREKKIGMELYFFLSIVAMSLPKMGGKKKVVVEIQGGILKKKRCYVHNIFTTFSQQITGDQLL